MKSRCLNTKATRFAAYGGRGIRVCERWVLSFELFLEDMGPRPSAKHQIDRIDNDGDYEPGNCRWITADENRNRQRGRARLRPITFRGRSLLPGEWASVTGINRSTICDRLDRGWPVERALTQPADRRLSALAASEARVSPAAH
jgi:hypothetical protein